MPEIDVRVREDVPAAPRDWMRGKLREVRAVISRAARVEMKFVGAYLWAPLGSSNFFVVEIRVDGHKDEFFGEQMDKILRELAECVPLGWRFGVWVRPEGRPWVYHGEYSEGQPLLGTGEYFEDPPPDPRED